MAKIEIIIDDRERAVLPYFNAISIPPNITFSCQRINHGDYSIMYKDYILFIIERKSWKDLAASLRDGRKENINKLIKIREETGCQLLYLIEGNPIPKSNTKFCRVPYKALRSHLDHLAFRDGIHMVYSKDQHNTAERIVELVRNYLTIKPNPLAEIDALEADGGGVDKLKEKTPVSADSIIYKIWCCIPNITEKTSSLFIEKNHHISDLILGNITKEYISTLKYDNGYIIGARSTKIWNCSRIKPENTKYFVKMLTQINGITKKTAEVLLTTISMEELLKGNITKEVLSAVEKTADKKLGIKKAVEILKYFTPASADI